ncbi:MAG: beta-lactamase family protein [Flavobacteriaceae bacterium]
MQKVCKKHFHEHIAKPLRLNVTRYISNKKNQSNKARAFKDGEWKALKNQGDKEFGAAYGINTNAKDFARWIIALMNKEGLNKENYQELFKNQTILPEDHPNRAQGVSALTLGFYAGDLPIGRIYGHEGNNDREFTCMFYFIPEMKWGTVLFTNSSHGEQIGLKLFQYMLSIQ